MEQINLAVEGHVAHITLQRPEKLNAITPAMLRALATVADTLEQTADVRVAILAGAGKRAFSVGADIRAWSQLKPLDMWRTWIPEGHRAMNRLARLRIPLIAAIHGYALGGGLELALTADIRIAADTSTFAMPEVAIATLPGWGGTARLATTIGLARAKEMIFSAEQIDARTAEKWGLVNRVTSPATLMEEAGGLAQQIAAQAPAAVQMAKQCIDGRTSEALAGALTATLEDAQEGRASFEERRQAQYQGK